jgi:hypothetical protein
MVSCGGGGAGAAAVCAGVEGLEGSATGVLLDWACREEARAGVAGAPELPGPEGDCPPGLLDLRPLLRPLVL